MIGMSMRSTAMRLCSSRPSRSGRVMSRTRQLGPKTRGRARNSSADPNVSDSQPALLIKGSRDSRTDRSSSTTNTMGVASDRGNDFDSWPGVLANLMHIPYATYPLYVDSRLHMVVVNDLPLRTLEHIQPIGYHTFI